MKKLGTNIHKRNCKGYKMGYFDANCNFVFGTNSLVLYLKHKITNLHSMPKIEIKEAHTLLPQEAQQRISTLISELKIKHKDQISDINEVWNGNKCSFSFKLMGFRTEGTIEVHQTSIELQGNIPFAALVFKGSIESTIRSQARQLLAC
ncbi:MAG: hypothetical protein RIS47_229 [Bacteroidota bacterium]|jgi:hypothetical protein